MIVITSLDDKMIKYVNPGDTFCLSIRTDLPDGTVEEQIITEVITVIKMIDYVCSFRFAEEDGTVLGFHLSGFFGNKAELPDEMKNAKKLEDLTPEQLENFNKSAGVIVK